MTSGARSASGGRGKEKSAFLPCLRITEGYTSSVATSTTPGALRRYSTKVAFRRPSSRRMCSRVNQLAEFSKAKAKAMGVVLPVNRPISQLAGG